MTQLPDWIVAGCTIASSLGTALFVSFKVGTLVERLAAVEKDMVEMRGDLKDYISPNWPNQNRRKQR